MLCQNFVKILTHSPGLIRPHRFASLLRSKTKQWGLIKIYHNKCISLLLPFAIIRITGHKGALRIVDEPSRQARLPRYHHGH